MSISRLDPSSAYDKTTIVLHWIVAGLFLFQWLGANTIDWFPRGPLRVDARSLHIVVGVVLTGTLLVRLYWRARHGARFATDPSITTLVAKGVHVALYCGVLAILGLGLFNTWLRGDSLFGVVHIPKFGAYDDTMRHQFVEQVVGLHRLAANVVLAVASLHALMALVHFYLIKDRVLQRMMPFLSPFN